MDEINSLKNLWQLEPEVFMQGMRAMDGVRQSDQNALMQQQLANQQATLQNQFAQESNPLKLEQARFGLMKDRAMFPGEQTIQQQTIDKGIRADEMTPDKAMQAFTAAAAIAQNPAMQNPAIHGMMKQMLGKAYHPSMDEWTPQQFGEFLPQIVNNYSKLMPKQQGAVDLQRLKDEAALAREQEKTRRGETLARLKASAKSGAEARAPKDPKSLGEYAARLFAQADQLSGPGATEEDLARAETLTAMANEYQRRFEQARLNERTAAAGGAIDPGALKKPDGTPRFEVKPKVVPTTPETPTAKPSQGGPYTDAEKERRYQEWVKKQQGG